MLGTSTAIKLTDYTSGNQYAAYFHNPDGRRTGNIAYCLKRGNAMIHTYYRASGIAKANYDGIVDCYISMNTFTKNSRSTKDLKRLCNLYVDLDIYKSRYKDVDKEAILSELAETKFGSVLPWPTAVIDSGGGMYLIWHLRNEDRNALPRYLSVEQYLVNALMDYGADRACTDASRILRVPGTINSKCGKTVRVMYHQDTAYTLHEIIREYNIHSSNRVYTGKKDLKKHPYGTATEKMRLAAANIHTATGYALPDFENFQETFDYIAEFGKYIRPHREEQNRILRRVIPFAETATRNIYLKECLQDIETVLKSRTGENCKREYGLFLYRLYQQELTGDAKLALERTLALNAALSCPFSESYVIVRTASAQKKLDGGETYHYKRDTVIAALEITAAEMDTLPLSVYSGAATPKERKARANRRAYKRRLEEQGKQEKKSTVAERRERFAAMLKEGKTREEIINELALSKATYYRDLAAIRAMECVEVCTQSAANAAEKIMETFKTVKETAIKAVEAAGSIMESLTGKEQSQARPHEVEKNIDAAVSQKFSTSIIAGRRSRPARPFVASDGAFLNFGPGYGRGDGDGVTPRRPPADAEEQPG